MFEKALQSFSRAQVIFKTSLFFGFFYHVIVYHVTILVDKGVEKKCCYLVIGCVPQCKEFIFETIHKQAVAYYVGLINFKGI